MLKQEVRRSNGYAYVSFSYRNKSKTYRVHRLVAEAFIPNPENKPQVNHIDGDKTNNRVDNLEWVTNRENTIHAWNTGLASKKLSERDVVEIYDLSVSNVYTCTQIAELYNISDATVRDIKNKRIWKRILQITH